MRGLERWAEAIQHCEGWYPGSRSYRNNNPGNLKFAGQEGAVGGDEEGYAVFVDFASGWKALVRQLEFAVSGRSRFYAPTMTLREFVHVYAPGSDPGYLVCIANRLGVSPEIEIRELAL